ncbi:MAG TPA: hypothetical protein VEO54_10450 [Thermoanaerobaculia bacterium]|nr:hypothetical protein [Thermoanaerobaculia bacterium]
MSDALALESLGTRARRFAFPLPDALLALLYAAAAAVDFLPPDRVAAIPPALLQAREGLVFALVVEGGFLLMQGMLVDIATSLRKRPAVWLIALIMAGLLLATAGPTAAVAKLAWDRGLLVFLPLLISLAERGYLLWSMPGRTPIQKIAARALVSNRLVTAVLLVAAMIAGRIHHGYEIAGLWPFLAAGAVYFAIAAYDDLRVRGKRFAAKPRVLFRYDALDIKDLRPL